MMIGMYAKICDADTSLVDTKSQFSDPMLNSKLISVLSDVCESLSRPFAG